MYMYISLVPRLPPLAHMYDRTRIDFSIMVWLDVLIMGVLGEKPGN